MRQSSLFVGRSRELTSGGSDCDSQWVEFLKFIRWSFLRMALPVANIYQGGPGRHLRPSKVESTCSHAPLPTLFPHFCLHLPPSVAHWRSALIGGEIRVYTYVPSQFFLKNEVNISDHIWPCETKQSDQTKQKCAAIFSFIFHLFQMKRQCMKQSNWTWNMVWNEMKWQLKQQVWHCTFLPQYHVNGKIVLCQK